MENTNSKFNSSILIIGMLANIGGIIAMFGIQGSMLLGIILCSVGILVIASIFIYSFVQNNKKLKAELKKANEHSLELLEHISLVRNSFKFDKCNEVHILGSGSETYFQILDGMFHHSILQKGIKIHLGYRIGKDEKRFAKLELYKEKWEDLANRFSLEITYYPINDFTFHFRGIVFNQEYGSIGFYHRKRTLTHGVSEKCFLIKGQNEVGLYMIKNFINCFNYINTSEKMITSNEKIS